MARKLMAGLIGLGGIAQSAHMEAYTKMENVEIAAVCDSLPQRIEEFRTRFGKPHVAGFTDFHDLLQVENLDFVDICTPNYLHAPVAVAAMRRGLHVFCEKPDAMNAAEAREMMEVARAQKRVLMVMRNNRFLETSEYLKQYIADGQMGEIYAARCGWQRRRGIPGKGGWFTTKAESGGGPLIDLGVHMIDLTVWLMGNPRPVSVSGCIYKKFADTNAVDSVHAAFGTAKEDGIMDVEDLAMGFIRFANGACLQIEFSWASNIEKEQRFLELRGSRAGAAWSSLDDRLKIFSEAYGQMVDHLPHIQNVRSSHAANIAHFVDVLTKDEAPMFVPQQGVDMMEILDGLYRSAKEGREVML